MKNLHIRPIQSTELPVLRTFLYHAIFQRDSANLLPRSVIDTPQLAIYIQDFGKPGDLCLLAEHQGTIAGAVWTRILAGDVKGFGNIDKNTPEFAISVLPEYRGRGIGTRLMQAMLELLKKHGYPSASLAVQKDNYAVKMYQKTGFCIIGENTEEYIMLAHLDAQ